MHAVHSEQILLRIAAFHDLAPIAAAHHERLDGKGYPRGLRGDAIDSRPASSPRRTSSTR